eukprot:1143185-Pelagomonas_calceolata.AAC.1
MRPKVSLLHHKANGDQEVQGCKHELGSCGLHPWNKLGEGELIPYPFHRHLPADRLPNPGEPFLHLNAVCLGQQLKQLLCKPPPPAAARPAPSSPPAVSSSSSPSPSINTNSRSSSSHTYKTQSNSTKPLSSTPSHNRSSSNCNPVSHTHIIPVNKQQEGEAATVRAHQPPTTQHQHHPPPAAGAAAPGQMTSGAVKKG